MGTATAFRTPEEAALELGLPLLGTLPALPEDEAPVVPGLPDRGKIRRAYRHAADRLLEGAPAAGRTIGVIGDVPPAQRARVTSTLAAMLALDGSVILVDADLRAAHLSFDAGRRAQEGLVDVLRYGVRSPRVVAPTGIPGLSLLPVGSGTVDLAGTWASEACGGLFSELGRGGECIVVNGPGAKDLRDAGNLLAHVDAWVVVHGLDRSEVEATRSLRDALGSEKGAGVLVIASPETVSVTAPEPRPEPVVAPFVPTPPEPVGAASGTLPVADAEARPRPPETARRRGNRAGWIAVALVAVVAAAFAWLRPWEREAPAPVVPRASAPEPVTVAAPERETTARDAQEPAVAQPQATEPEPVVQDAAATEPPPEPAAQEVEAETSGPAPRDLAVPLGTAGPLFGVHVASLKTDSGAREEAARVAASGYPTVLRELEVPGKGRWVRVYVGPYGEMAVAQEVAREIRESGLESYVQVHRLPADELREGTGREDR